MLVEGLLEGAVRAKDADRRVLRVDELLGGIEDLAWQDVEGELGHKPPAGFDQVVHATPDGSARLVRKVRHGGSFKTEGGAEVTLLIPAS